MYYPLQRSVNVKLRIGDYGGTQRGTLVNKKTFTEMFWEVTYARFQLPTVLISLTVIDFLFI